MSFLTTLWLVGAASAGVLDLRQASSSEHPSATVPDYFQTTPEVYPGPTVTGKPPFLALSNPGPWGMSYVPPTPLETALPISGNTNNQSIFQLLGQLSPYFPNPVGFGSDEYPLPPGANLTHAHILHRHGSRYPTGDSSVSTFGSKLQNITGNGTASWSGELSFLNNWRYHLGAEILVPRGRQELFDSGVQSYYSYGALYNTSTKIIARTTSQDRMLKSAENFMAGFFGLEWTNNVTLEPILEIPSGSNNSLAGYFGCNNSNTYVSTGGNNASRIWENKYLANATQRLKALSGGYNWTVADTYNAQTLCPYETVAFGYSAFCDLFTYEEWQGFEYTIDLQFYGNNGFGSPTGRGVGIGYVEEIYARLQNRLYDLVPGATQANVTLDTMNSTFPLNQTLYFDFSHDTNIFSIITALGLRQFNQSLPTSGPPQNQQATVSHMTPFGARMVWEIIQTPYPVKAKRPSTSPGANNTLDSYYDTNGTATTYVHLTLSQRTIPLYKSYPQCEERDDGWCEIGTYLDVLGGLLDQAQYEYGCYGNYPSPKYGQTTDGVPVNGTSQSQRKRNAGALALIERRGLGSDDFWL
ncbi:uncharacterized protein HMPREF1541_02454 [Cyphellophora europaea CBS 101466]|uniref:3-phytase n=1 Tax=Cyphellophora europaea (strain CBS 101466) TaxID=1220924 RepID=W2S3W0_CYPE1|nr:uncharacterized protein HMPREF1541_02454 [Cyphellophora europaea CBS 101466]ETN43295.1 hypothetical protein HMPREF1541_02454 [Cyphellophora europaea CBS 101466]